MLCDGSVGAIVVDSVTFVTSVVPFVTSGLVVAFVVVAMAVVVGTVTVVFVVSVVTVAVVVVSVLLAFSTPLFCWFPPLSTGGSAGPVSPVAAFNEAALL